MEFSEREDQPCRVRGRLRDQRGERAELGHVGFRVAGPADARQVEEETGFDLTGRINAVDNIQTQINAQVVTMFIVKDIHESTVFEAQTRKEIGVGVVSVSSV